MIKCDYCGRENQDESASCPGCGTPPVTTPDKEQGEPGRPTSVWGLLDCAIGAGQIAVGHVGGVIHLVKGLSELDSSGRENSPHRLLEHAAALESVDMRRAIALYKQIALDHPGTRAAREAHRNVQTLKAAHPELEEL